MSHKDEEALSRIGENIAVASDKRGRGATLDVLSGMREILGAARFNHLMQTIGRRRVEAEWTSFTTSGSVEDGLTELFERLSRGGWGRVEIMKLAPGAREASFRVHRGWEAAYQKALSVVGEAGCMEGILAECCGRVFGVPCRAEQVRFAAIDGDYDEIVVRAAARDEVEGAPADRTADKVDVIDALEQEIKERSITEAALRASEGRLRGFLESGMLGFSMTSPKTGWLEANDRLCEILGYPREELFQKAWPELTHPEDLPADIAALKRLHAGEIDSITHEKRFIRKDGEVADVIVNVQAMRRPDRSVEYVVALVQDVTEKKLAERELRRHEQTIKQQEEAIRILSAPLIHVWDGVLALPIVGPLNGERAGLIMNQLLARIAERRVRHAILDLTGVDAVDPTTAEHLMHIVNTVRLLGANALVSGISPTVAQTMVYSGVNFSGVVTRGTLHEALKTCIAFGEEGGGVRTAPARRTP